MSPYVTKLEQSVVYYFCKCNDCWRSQLCLKGRLLW